MRVVSIRWSDTLMAGLGQAAACVIRCLGPLPPSTVHTHRQRLPNMSSNGSMLQPARVDVAADGCACRFCLRSAATQCCPWSPGITLKIPQAGERKACSEWTCQPLQRNAWHQPSLCHFSQPAHLKQPSTGQLLRSRVALWWLPVQGLVTSPWNST